MGGLKLGRMTLSSMFKKPATIKYPMEQKDKPDGLKGQITIDVDSCILCGICMKSCCADAIGVDKESLVWTIDRFRCVQCGFCVYACPKHCLAMLPDYNKPSVSKSVYEYVIGKS